MRNLTKTLAILSLLTPVVGYPLGIGDFKLHSALNQNLNAEIPLTLSAGENAADIKVNLAPAAKFDEAGVPWTYFLSKIKFQTVVNANGSVVIKVSSKEALKEPFLNLLVEVSWPKGSLYREFTVLIDPPSTYNTSASATPAASGKLSVATTAPVMAVKPPVVTTAPVTAVKLPIVNAPVTAGKPPVVAGTPTADKPLISAPATQPLKSAGYEQSKPPVVTQTLPAQPATVQHSAGSTYGPVHKKETLWSVAVKFSKERDASVEQTLMAIYEANPYAFHRNNVFGLLSGETLQIPDKADVAKLSREEAITAYNLQKKAWKNGVTLNSPDVIPTTTKPSVPPPAVSVSIPEKVSKPAIPAVNIADNQPKEVTAESLKTPETSKEIPVSSSEDASLLDKVAALEKQLKATKKALASKEKQIDEIKSSQVAPAGITEPVVPAEVVKLVDPVEVAKPVVKLETINPIVPFESINSVAPLEAIKLATPLEVIKISEVAKPPVDAVTPVPPTPVGAVTPVPPTPVGAVTPVPPTPVDVVKPVPPTPVGAVTPVPPTPVGAVTPVPPTPVGAVKPVPPTPVGAVKPVPPTPVGAVTPVPPTPVGAVTPVPPTPVGAVTPVPPTPVGAVTPVPPTPIGAVTPVSQDKLEPMEALDSFNLIFGGGGAALVSVLGFIWWRKRKKAMETPIYPSSIMGKNEVQGILPTMDDESNLGDGWNTFNPDNTQNEGESVFGNDWIINIDEDQNDIDPISEADVYLAYGRYQQAEELMRDAIKEQPNRDECKLKLLEIFYASENRDAFEVYVAELVGEGKKGDTEFWDKVVEMGSEICPDSISFSSGGNVGKAINSPALESDVSNAAKKADFDSAETNVAADKQHDNKDDFESIDLTGGVEPQLHKDDIESFDFDDFASDSKTEAADVAIASAATDGKDDFESFDFDDFALDSKTEAAAPVAPAIDTKDDFESFDFDDFALDSKTEAAAPVAPAIDTKDDFESFDFDDFALDSKTEAVAPVAPVAPAIDTKDDFESFDFDDFALDSKTEAADVAPVAPAIDTKDDFESFDFDDFALDSKTEAADVAPVAPAIDTKDDFESFDFDDFALDSKTEAADVAPVAPAIDTKDDFESFDFDDFALDSKTEATAPVAPAIDTKDDFESFDFDDFALDSKTEAVAPVAPAIDTKDDFESFDLSAQSDEVKELDAFGVADSDIDFDFDFDMPATALDGKDARQQGSFGSPELTDMDEFETKLDLARAYIDMGDAQAARDITEEVLRKGTVEQKKLAESILDILK